jgi:hypothetical protein
MRFLTCLLLLSIPNLCFAIEKPKTKIAAAPYELAGLLDNWNKEILSKRENFFKSDKKSAEAYEIFAESVEYTLKHPEPKLIEALTLLAASMAFYDNSGYVGGMMLPVLKEHSALVKLAAQKLPEKFREEFFRLMKTRIQESREGNG